MGNTKTILGFIAGASIGAIAGILLAPDKGAATRKKIVDKSGDLKDAIKDGVLGWLDKLEKSAAAEIKQEEERTVPKMNTDLQ
jgi:gas vesicle protein